MIPLWELGYACASPNTSSLGIEDKLALESDADGKILRTILRHTSAILNNNLLILLYRPLSAMTSPFPPSSIRPILNEVTTLLTSRKETVSIAETVSLPLHTSTNP